MALSTFISLFIICPVNVNANTVASRPKTKNLGNLLVITQRIWTYIQSEFLRHAQNWEKSRQSGHISKKSSATQRMLKLPGRQSVKAICPDPKHINLPNNDECHCTDFDAEKGAIVPYVAGTNSVSDFSKTISRELEENLKQEYSVVSIHAPVVSKPKPAKCPYDQETSLSTSLLETPVKNINSSSEMSTTQRTPAELVYSSAELMSATPKR
ncbi:unnamed protein product [Fraxinus pennsylvanica]|uniref:Uncharacterized protein n=1 Tax=Fraxinus pennsylvanica TaxID=56036 RepID=A0AAD2A430_9LAMI|nr:unnamed protein product [Fraxinus pennsylvanica]